ncbi:hypothetical protein HAX54_036009, partial [Datura stramonium]|nr:hypothetical protein [Datura stramonium]
MASMAIGQTSAMYDQSAIPTSPTNHPPHLNYAYIFKPQNNSPQPKHSIPVKPVSLLHGEPYIRWTEAEVEKMNIIENLQHAV